MRNTGDAAPPVTGGVGWVASIRRARQMPMHLIRSIEECSLNAWPPLRQHLLDGWLLRFADGFTRRANSVNAIYAGQLPPEEKIARCEAVYTSLGQPCVFRITPLAHPRELDDRLAARGYRREGETSVQVLDALPAASEPEPACDLLAAASHRWLSLFAGLDGTPPRHRRTLEAILARIPPPHTGAILTVAGHPVSCGRAVLEHTQIGLFDIATDSARRRQGYAGRLINGLLGWGRGGGARRAYLQVEADNTPARELYEKLGFREIYRYWYRVR